MRTKFLQLVFALFATLPAWADSETNWIANYDQALHIAADSRRPVFLDFSAIWCGPCQMMARTTLKDAGVVKKLDNFVKVKVDIDVSAALAQRFGVHAVPTFVVVDASGGELVRTSGARDAAAFGQWLDEALTNAASAAGRRDAFDREKAAVADELQDADPQNQGRAVTTLIDYSFRKEKYYRDFAAEKLKVIAQKHPALFLELLNHKKLGVRILAANLLRDNIGPDFVFDPWTNAAARTVIIEKWKARIGPIGRPSPE